MPAVPSKLYKYRDTGDYTEGIFQNAELFFALPRDFNDPFDCGFRLRVEGTRNQEVIESLAFAEIEKSPLALSLAESLEGAKQVGAAIIQNHKDRFTRISDDKLAEDTNKKVGILSLSEKNDDILMWSHYANCHKGICLEFSTPQSGFFDTAQKVNYADEYPTWDLREMVTEEDLWKTAPWMLTKARQWKYEQEWRVLDFNGGPGPKSFPRSALTGVILGCRTSDDDRAKVLSWIRSGELDAKVYKARELSGEFRLDIEPITPEPHG